MFTPLQPTGRSRWDLSLVASFAAHVVVILLLAHHSPPVFVMPSDVALGTPGSSGSVIYLAPIGAEKSAAAPEKPKLTLHPSLAKIPPAPKPTPLTTED